MWYSKLLQRCFKTVVYGYVWVWISLIIMFIDLNFLEANKQRVSGTTRRKQAIDGQTEQQKE